MTLRAHWSDEVAPIADLVGLTIAAIDGMTKGSERIEFRTTCGRRFVMYHNESCCERVDVEDVIGDVEDLIGTPIVLADDVSSDESLVPDVVREFRPDSETWTFVKLATVKGYVTLRWYGSSNGYYSEEPVFVEIKQVRR